MEDNARQQKSKADMEKKGLGWVPDYPDLRDYNLNDEDAIKNKLRFKTEENTSNIENIVQVLLNFIELQKTENKNNYDQDRIDEIKNKIFGRALFVKVKVHRLLRDLFKDETIENEYPLYKKIRSESMLPKYIIELNKYLGVLLMGEYLSPPKSLTGEKEWLKTPEGINWVLEFMRKENYDDDTKDLVKQFQCLSKIKDDGVFGLETYITLNEYFSNYQELSRLKESCSQEQVKNQKYPKRIQYFSAASLKIPSKGIEKILTTLIIKAVEQIRSKKYEQENIFEYHFLEKIQAKRKYLFRDNLVDNDVWKEIFSKETIQMDNLSIKYKINQIFNHPNNKFFLEFQKISEVLQSSYVIEPIVSVFAKILYPLAKWQNKTFEELLEKGFKEFEKIASQNNSSNNHNFTIEAGYSKKQLVEHAIDKVIYLLSLEIHSLVEEINDKNISAIFFYFVLKKYLNSFIHTKSAEDAISNNQEPKPNIFDKQELFEIQQLINYSGISSYISNSEQEQCELFPNIDLYIPIFNNVSSNQIKVFNEQKINQISEDAGQKNATIKPCKRQFCMLPGVIDLSYWFSRIRDQGSLNSCTAFAAIALLEYFENRNYGKSVDASPLFLYKAARKKMNIEGDVGASIRETMKVLALLGVPPEDSWRYDEDLVNEEPPAYCYAYAQNYRSLKYFFLDYAGITKESLLFQIKAVLAAGFPCIFGFTIYSSAYDNSNYKKGLIPFPDPQKDKVIGGHTVVAVGYDDYKFIQCSDRGYYSKGAFLIRNSWGTEWGIGGYGWLPYDYVLAGLTAAWWSLLKAEWFDESNFGGAGNSGGPADTGQGGKSGTRP